MISSILFVDDDPNLLGAYRRQFRKLYNVDTALGTQEGLAAVANGQYAVVVSDMRMPGMNGLQFLARVREISPATVHVILTGDAGLKSADRGAASQHVFRFLEKPCSRESLTKCLQEALEEHARISTAGRHCPIADGDSPFAALGSTQAG
ncbi:MAG: response regulator [Planctomycetia bacterium]|nr:response regulator [Planctomycetia bacterium]